jgi:hypothetical protein
LAIIYLMPWECIAYSQGGYTAHLDLDTGTLKGLEAAAGDFTTSRARRGGFSDATPHLPSILTAQFQRQQGRAQTQELAGIKGNKDDMAKEGMRTEDYESMTDAAGSFD